MRDGHDVQLRSFVKHAGAYPPKPGFFAHEIEPKLRAAGEFRIARQAYERGSASAYDKLKTALQNQNFVDWRAYDALLKAAKHNPSGAAKALRKLWNESEALSTRLSKFTNFLNSVDIHKTGSQLSISSLLLFGISGEDYPHVVTNAFNDAFESAGYPRFAPTQNAAERYLHALEFFDLLISESKNFGMLLADRLTARAVAWCVGQEVDPSYYDRGIDVEPYGELTRSEALALIRKSARGMSLSATETEALINARVGQGTFRRNLLQAWGKCSVTGCRHTTLLHASHIKPWRYSTNAERLDPYNGLLLSPALDAAFDRGLISFRDDGAIIISEELASHDLKCMGLNDKMKLEYVDVEHVPYLNYHRSRRF